MKPIHVTGPPCAGKTTYALEHMTDRDVVIDLDRIAHALGYPTPQLDWTDPTHPAWKAALRARASALKSTHGLPGTVWIIGPDPGPHHPNVIRLDPGRDECLRRARADNRPQATVNAIERWYSDHPTPPAQPTRQW